MRTLAALPDATRVVLRNVLIAFVVLDLAALVAFSVRIDTVTRTTSTPLATPVVVPSPTAPGGLPTAVPAPPLAVVPIVEGPVATTTAATSTPKPRPTPRPAATPTGETPLPDDSVRTQPCPIPVASSTTDGGLQSLIDFAPAFGPFKAEAFAAAAAYQPALQLIGPILAKYPALAPKLAPLVDPLVSSAQQFLDAGFALLGPLYTPYRQQFLEAEGKLAAALAPYAQQLTASPLGGCVIALQNALLHDTNA